ncbi:uncharacterized protein LOC132718114 [Ruditapes philippinarum]|uniref:uncharacterized protein LOC132718114 n=1 Tax=Ruditapes philippinarum TaxID=129788 RepID=UPI00295C1312|nr:uncharacterized protein LOC132718114 [Ruditapes philippinarum]
MENYLVFRSCPAIHSIPEEVDTLYKQPLSNKIISGLVEEKQQFTDIKQRKQHLITEIKKEKKIAIDSILDYKKELEDELKRLERESVKLVEKEYGSIEQELQNAIKESDKCIDEFQQSEDKLQKSQGNKAQEFVSIKTAQRIIRTASESKKMLNKSVVAHITFTMNANIKQFLKQTGVLGHVPRTTVYNVKQHSSFSAKMKSDGSCRLYHSCLLEDGSLLVTDVKNKKLKRVDTTNYTITDHLDMEAGPIAVCQTDKQEVAVSLQKKSIVFVTIDNKMVVTRKLDMDHHCCSIAYNKNKLVISDEKNAVYIYNMNGSMIRKITSDNSGKSIFSDTRHISLSTNREYVYVCDSKNGLITLDTQGNHISTFTDDDMSGPQGVCTDGRGNIFVGAYTSSNIIQIREDSMTKIGVIKTDTNPLSVCFDTNKNIIFVTHHDQNSIKIYTLE